MGPSGLVAVCRNADVDSMRRRRTRFVLITAVWSYNDRLLRQYCEELDQQCTIRYCLSRNIIHWEMREWSTSLDMETIL